MNESFHDITVNHALGNRKRGKRMNDNDRRIISEPDENGRRYFDLSSDKEKIEMAAEQGTNGNADNAGTREANVQGSTGESTNTVYAKTKQKKKIVKSAITIAVIFIVMCLVGVSCKAIGKQLRTYNTAELNVGNYPYIATLYVEGTIQDGNTDYFGNATGYQHQWTLDIIDELMWDDNNRGIIFFVNSPGGSVYESDELYLKIQEYKEFTGRPVYSVMGNMAASGAYYISAPCDRILANRNTWTGSIGVTVGTFVDVSGFLERYGIKTTTINSGAHKAMGSSYQEMTDEERAIWQSLVDEAFDQFVSIVAEGRNLDTAYVYEIADGRILSANQALELGLIDEIGGVDDAYYEMMDEIEEYNVDLVDVEYVNNNSALYNILGGVSKAMEDMKGNEAESVMSVVNRINTEPVSYYCEILSQN